MGMLFEDLMAAADDGYKPDRTQKRRKQAGSKNTRAQGACENDAKGALVSRRPFPPKLRGELGELDFLRKALGMGMLVSKPWGDSYRYDFVVDCQGKLWRFQVRSTESRNRLIGYEVQSSYHVGKRAVPLTAKDIDVLVAFISTRDIWYVLPVRAFAPRAALRFYPDGCATGGLFEEYREAWWVLTGGK
jgi:hypothetical protein